MPPRRPRPTIPAFLLDPLQAQALVHELLAARDSIPEPDRADPLRHLVATRKAQLGAWAVQLSQAFGGYASNGRVHEPGTFPDGGPADPPGFMGDTIPE